MKNRKPISFLIYLVILIIVFAAGVYTGRRLSPLKSREGVISESSLKQESALTSSINTGNAPSAPPIASTPAINKLAKKHAPAIARSKTSSTPAKTFYTIQVAAFSSYSKAKKIAGEIDSMGFIAYIVPYKTYQLVRVGKFSSTKGLKSIKGILAKKFNVKPYVMRIQ